MPVSARERDLTTKKKSREGRGPGGNSRSQKIYFSPVQKPVFQAGTIDPVQKEMEQDRQGQVGRGDGGRGRGRGLWDGGEWGEAGERGEGGGGGGLMTESGENI